MHGEQRPGWHFAHAQADLNLLIWRMIEGTFSLDEEQMGEVLWQAGVSKRRFWAKFERQMEGLTHMRSRMIHVSLRIHAAVLQLDSSGCKVFYG